MRVILDTNVFLSYLAAPDTERALTWVVRTCLTREDIEIVVPPELIDELSEKVVEKKYFRERVPQEKAAEFIEQLHLLADLSSPLEDIPVFSRDPGDDYLIAHGIVNEVDYIVTGDADLLVLKRVEHLQIMTPSAFLIHLRGTSIERLM